MALSRRRQTLEQAVGFTGLGALLGVFLGLSSSPVVGAAIAGLLSLATGLLSTVGTARLVPTKSPLRTEVPPADASAVQLASAATADGKPPPATADGKPPAIPAEKPTAKKQARKSSTAISFLAIGSFSFSCLLATLGGVYIRTHRILEKDITARVTTWINAGYEPEVARRLVLHEQFGEIPPNALNPTQKTTHDAEKIADGTGKASEGVKGKHPTAVPNLTAGVLFGKEDEGGCAELFRVNYLSAEDALAAFRKERGNWRKVADFVSTNTQTPEERLKALQIIKDYLCEQNDASP